MRWLIFCIAVATATALKINNKHPCDNLDCRAGRECVVVEGDAQCVCVVSCPDHFKPVCGTDGSTYENHCRLHQKACISGQHIGIEHKGHCKKSYDKQWKKDKKKSTLSKQDLEMELQNDIIKRLKKDEKEQTHDDVKAPAACFGPQRNALRFLLVEHWQEDLKTQPWHVEGMTYRESLWGWFFTCDENKNNYLTPEELLKCAKDVAFFARPGQDNKLTKALCIDAMVDDGDKNRDWRLDFEEFTTIMDAKYQPKEKKCSLDGKNYIDGDEVRVDCNKCVCAVGNWVCASSAKCATGESPKKKSSPFGGRGSADIDNSIDEANNVIDRVTVADLWMENNKKDKRKGKKNSDKEQFDVDDNLFLDFDSENDDLKNDQNIDEDELKLDEYYDDLFESTKLKNPKKRKYQLEKALKEVKLLQKQTKHLKKLLTRENPKKKEIKDSFIPKKIHNKRLQETDLKDVKEVKAFRRDNKPLDAKSKEYYDRQFENTKWNDLIDWGVMKKVKQNKNRYPHKNKL